MTSSHSSPPLQASDTPLVSVVIPCLNAATTIANCLASIAASDYPQSQLEVLVVDGMSTDDTREILATCRTRYPFLRMLDNPARTQQKALNIGIRASKGDVIIRMDAHCSFEPTYISQSVRHLFAYGADNVGGRLITLSRDSTLRGRAIALAMSTPFGVGHSPFRIWRDTDSTEPRWVESVPYSCYRRRVFETVGLFNEDLDRSEDAEFHQRMRRYGCRTLFVPTLVSRYFARSELRSFFAHAIDNGRWAILPTKFTGYLVVSWRHCVPMVAMITTLICVIATFLLPWLLAPLSFLIIIYGCCNGLASFRVVQQEGNWRLLVPLSIVFMLLHLGYGWGSFLAAGEVGFSRFGCMIRRKRARISPKSHSL